MYLALSNDGQWLFDDLNQTNLPIGVANLVSGQYDYEFADEVLVVQKVLAKDSVGTWTELRPYGFEDDELDNLWKLTSGNSGSPVRYQKLAHSILLDPVPNYNSTGGLKVVFKRNAPRFASTDTTTDPGIPSIFHVYLARYASLPFLIEKNLPQANGVASLIQQDEQAIKDYFSVRSKDIRGKLKPVVEDCR